MGRSGLSVETLRVDNPAAASAWTALEAGGAVRVPFQSWAWTGAFAQVPELADDIRVQVVREGPEPIAVLATETWIKRGRRVLGIAGDRWLVPDHMDIVARPGREPEAATALIHHLMASVAWDVLDLDGLRIPSALAQAASAELRGPRFFARQPERLVTPYVDLAPLAATGRHRSKNLRPQIRRGDRQLHAFGGGVEVVTSAEGLVSELDWIGARHSARFGEESPVFATPGRRAFHAAAARRLAVQGAARAYRLTVDGVTEASLYFLIWDGTAFPYLGAFGARRLRAPGTYVHALSFLDLARQGFREVDLLRGDYPWKRQYQSGLRHNARLRYYRWTARNLRATSAALVRRLRQAAGSGAR
jgi:CelD/BcsL family acetyltransferase involved in cellulose biosynthesis